MHFWSTARYDLGLSDEDFYALTLRQFDALVKRKKIATMANEFLFAQLTSWIANTGFKSASKTTVPRDFMPSMRDAVVAKPKPKRVRMTKKRREAVANQIRMMFPNLNKKV